MRYYKGFSKATIRVLEGFWGCWGLGFGGWLWVFRALEVVAVIFGSGSENYKQGYRGQGFGVEVSRALG